MGDPRIEGLHPEELEHRDSINRFLAESFDKVLEKIGDGPRIIAASDGAFHALAFSGSRDHPDPKGALVACFIGLIVTVGHALQDNGHTPVGFPDISFAMERAEALLEQPFGTGDDGQHVVARFVEREIGDKSKEGPPTPTS